MTRAEAERRVLEVLKRDRGTLASCIADAIWPGHDMKPQAAALAAGGILGRMRRRRLVGYDPDGRIPDFPEQCSVCRQRWTVRLGEVEPVFGQTGRVEVVPVVWTIRGLR